MATSVLWLRRDLRRHDLPALLEAAGDGNAVLPLFVLDPVLWKSGGDARRAWLAATLRAVDEAYDGRLVLRTGDPVTVLPQVCAEAGATSVHVSRETTPFGRRRDEMVSRALADADIDFVATGSPYAVGPGVIRNGTGSPYQVFTPFQSAWSEHGWPEPCAEPDGLRLAEGTSDEHVRRLLDEALAADGLPDLPEAGEAAAGRRLTAFVESGLPGYDGDRDRPDRDATSRLSPYLKLGALHPRTVLDAIARRRSAGAERFRAEIAWREFYADVLWHSPASAWADLRNSLSGIRYDEPGNGVEAWKAGRTGYPIVDAGMRQLLGCGWMHNRVRMITASFLTKDLHVWWPIGARHFLEHLIDGDIASNNHGWQWVAGTGTDAAPYFRVFNPVTQGQKFDPDGDYVRRFVPELAHLDRATAHEPWKHPDGYAGGYPERIVDHAKERVEALTRYREVRG
jgi:deoxyribodipyrimidine photo-lyase